MDDPPFRLMTFHARHVADVRATPTLDAVADTLLLKLEARRHSAVGTGRRRDAPPTPPERRRVMALDDILADARDRIIEHMAIGDEFMHRLKREGDDSLSERGTSGGLMQEAVRSFA